MLAIRLSRTGKKHQAYFRIVVSDSHRTPTAKFVEILGNYDPHAKKLQIDKERLDFYLKNGAQPSNSLAKLLKSEKVELPKWVKITEKNRAPKKTEEKAEPKAEAAETPAEGETPTENAEAVKETPAEEKAEETTPESSKVEKSEEPAVAPEEKPAEEVPDETKDVDSEDESSKEENAAK